MKRKALTKMTELKTLQKLNPMLDLRDINDPVFLRYAKVLNYDDFLSYADYLDQKTHMPEMNNQYIADDVRLHQEEHNEELLKHVFGNTPLQFGYVNGYNSSLNALEWHPSPEINIALTPLVLMLGHVDDVKDLTYEVKNIQAFYIPAHSVVMFYPTTLHFSPCKVSDAGFKCGVILPYGTNMAFTSKEEKMEKNDPLLFKTNKWLIAHHENKTVIELGAHAGLIGENLKIIYKG
ncbi:MAG TPA: DUF4867 domain-containing protein [Acholeplasmataceae bacterium]|nr:DUF4867 domain-containing protein [Acholeplasmataceae bacterium]HBO68415.1 DUF4867 domain-containing protein [Acholeplasmataceae bacterium]HBS00803.1 DUF4867 domain-containing protein [Acholeplasmataceae bacterium]HCZ23331.1 DUF4867 domain-containing protein [Acholeplasmataceae bacterium]